MMQTPKEAETSASAASAGSESKSPAPRRSTRLSTPPSSAVASSAKVTKTRYACVLRVIAYSQRSRSDRKRGASATSRKTKAKAGAELRTSGLSEPPSLILCLDPLWQLPRRKQRNKLPPCPTTASPTPTRTRRMKLRSSIRGSSTRHLRPSDTLLQRQLLHLRPLRLLRLAWSAGRLHLLVLVLRLRHLAAERSASQHVMTLTNPPPFRLLPSALRPKFRLFLQQPLRQRRMIPLLLLLSKSGSALGGRLLPSLPIQRLQPSRPSGKCLMMRPSAPGWTGRSARPARLIVRHARRREGLARPRRRTGCWSSTLETMRRPAYGSERLKHSLHRRRARRARTAIDVAARIV
jgi:hypothetical protein